MKTEIYIEEGDNCPECKAKDSMHFPPVEGCYCHISAPCGACTGNLLTCKECGWEVDPPKPTESYRHVGGGITEVFTRNPSKELGEGKRIFDYDYDSRSGSSMVWKGKYKGNVTAADIIKEFGDGTFGHRGPFLKDGHFTYTKITD